jgi:polyisoprenyl-phosphate glycosyltransferase
MATPVLSIVIPVHNEADNIAPFSKLLLKHARLAVGEAYEVMYIDDGSSDLTAANIAKLAKRNKHIRLVRLSRNFGKEIAMAAGIAYARGKAILTIDGDGQHPAELIPDFVAAWRNGAQVVVGIRTSNTNEGFLKKYGSRLFYRMINSFSGFSMVPGSSDFRLIDREVQQEFIKLHEPLSLTRGLIDWLGYERTYITYKAGPRTAGEVAYKFRKLVRLAAHSFVSLTPVPLYVFGYLGVLITIISFALGSTVFVEQVLLNDPWHWKFTGTAMLSILVIFLVGLTLVAQGVLALYIYHTYTQSKGRPLYTVNKKLSYRLNDSRS